MWNCEVEWSRSSIYLCWLPRIGCNENIHQLRNWKIIKMKFQVSRQFIFKKFSCIHLCFFQASRQTQQKSLLHLEHFMWLQPSFFWIGDLQLGQGLQLVTSQKQLAASSLSFFSNFSSSGLVSAILACHWFQWSQPTIEKIPISDWYTIRTLWNIESTTRSMSISETIPTKIMSISAINGMRERRSSWQRLSTGPNLCVDVKSIS